MILLDLFQVNIQKIMLIPKLTSISIPILLIY